MWRMVAVALWAHFFWCLGPIWRDGQYYEYGFLVPFLAFGFAWRRWYERPLPESPPWIPAKGWGALLVIVAILSLVFLVPLRVIGTGDPGWRPPLLIQAVMVTLASHSLVARGHGWRISLWFLPVTVFAWSAVPYVYQVEQALVRQLTGWVIAVTQEIFLLQGVPVESMGERLVLGQNVCEVTEGCSGIRSIQSLVMAALFFGELLWLRWFARVVLVAVALAAAVACNAGRAWYLASVQFERGLDAASAIHDTAGHVAFVIAAIVLYVAARSLMPSSRGRVVRRAVARTNPAT